MTRKHFELLAASLRASRPRETTDLWSELEHKAWRKVVDYLATDLIATNPNFNPARFRDACNATD
jgi:hypothetical protein